LCHSQVYCKIVTYSRAELLETYAQILDEIPFDETFISLGLFVPINQLEASVYEITPKLKKKLYSIAPKDQIRFRVLPL